MSTGKATTTKKRTFESNDLKWEKQPRKIVIAEEEDDFDHHLSSELKGIMSALKQIREKSQKDGQKKNAETISSVASDMKCMLDELKLKLDKERQSLAKALSKSSKECEYLLKNETAKFQAVYDKFCKEKAAHLETLKDTTSRFEKEKERLFIRYEQQRKKEKSMISEHEKACSNKIAELEESLKKKKQGDKTFRILRKTLGSLLNNEASDEDIDETILPD